METITTLERPVPEFQLCHRLRLALEQTEYEVPEIAEMLGISKSTAYHWMSGHSHPRRGMVKQWALICQVPWQWLETGVAPTGPEGGAATGDVIRQHRRGIRCDNPALLKRVA